MALLIAVVMLATSVVLGGGTHSGFFFDTLLQLLSVPALLFGIDRYLVRRQKRSGRVEVGLCFAIALVPLAQLVPLPRSVWQTLPSVDRRLEAFGFANADPHWLPISINPNETWLAVLSLLPPLAIFLLTLCLSHKDRRVLTACLVAMGLLSVFWGLAQLAQGETSGLRWYPVTNTTEAVGFFANRNHLSALIYIALVLAAVWSAYGLSGDLSILPKLQGQTRILAVALLSFTALFVLLSGEFMARSRAGLGLTIAALLICLIVIWAMAGHEFKGKAVTRITVAASALATVLALQFAIYRILDRFAFDPLQDARLIFYRNTIAAAKAYMPWGSGVGSFVRVYASLEQPQNALAGAYVNHAHNDFLELWLETGVIGIAISMCWGFWFCWRMARLWSRRTAMLAPLDVWSARAAAFAILLLLCHSFVDYPLHTGAMLVVFALLCGLLSEPVQLVAELQTAAHSKPDKSRRKAVGIKTQPTEVSSPLAALPGPKTLWTPQGQWPTAWGPPQENSQATDPDADDKSA